MLIYDKCAKEWNEALPLGNGKIGAMVYGTTEAERLSMNEESVWSGKFTDRNNPSALQYIDRIRELIKNNKVNEAEELALMAMSGTPCVQRTYQKAGELLVGYPKGEITDYRRSLDLSKGVCSVEYLRNGMKFREDIFISYKTNCGYIKLSTEAPMTFTVTVERDRMSDTVRAADNRVILKADTGIAFTFGAAVEADEVKVIGRYLMCRCEKEALIKFNITTEFRHQDHERICSETISASCDYEKIYSEHVSYNEGYFNRSSLELYESSELTTDKRIAENDGMIELLFNFGRYLLISCSSVGSLPANLQGIWNDLIFPPWDSKFTININTQMNYWPAEVCNLSELHMPLFEHIMRMLPNGMETAKKMYGVNGFVAHHNTDIWGDCAPQDEYIPATFWVFGGVWLCTHIIEHYRFTQDTEFLKKYYLCLKESARFFIEFLEEDADGYLAAVPSVSPENTYILEDGSRGRLCAGCAMDNQILRLFFEGFIEAAELIEPDDEILDKARNVLLRFRPIQTGRYGQIMEWNKDYDEAEKGHRHISHLFALYPGHEISPIFTPELTEAARITLKRRLENGGGHTGWSRAWIICFYARLFDGENALDNINKLVEKSLLPNMFDNHPPFQIDGNFGVCAAIAEMLLQSQNNELHILPALPSAWKRGRITGLRARGGFTVDIEWDEEKVVTKVKADRNGIFRIRFKDALLSEEIAEGELKEIEFRNQ